MYVIFIALWFYGLFPLNEEMRKNYVRDYQKIMSSYNVDGALSFKVTYRSFDRNSSAPDTALNAHFVLKGADFYSKMGATETYKNAQYYVAVNHALKKIAVNRAASVSTNILPFDKTDTLLSALKASIKYSVINQGKTGCYVIETPEQGDISKSKCIIEFNLTTYRVSRFVTYLYGYQPDPYADNHQTPSNHIPYIEMLFSNYSINRTTEDEKFSTSKYFTEKESGSVYLKSPYTQYQLINSLPYNLKK